MNKRTGLGGDVMVGCTLMLGGMESGYMQKLALYLRTKFEPSVSIGICRSFPAEYSADPKKNKNIIPLGSEAFIDEMKKYAPVMDGLVFSMEETGNAEEVYAYQSCENLYRQIRAHCHSLHVLPVGNARTGKQIITVVTGNTSVEKLMLFSACCSICDRKNGRTLFLNLSECSGMKTMMQMEEETDLGDLIQDIRKQKAVNLEWYVRPMEDVDVILPVGNPMILQEMEETDAEALLDLLEENTQYSRIWIMLGITFCGCDGLLQGADRVWHLEEPGLTYSAAERMRFLEQCMVNPDHRIRRLVLSESVNADREIMPEEITESRMYHFAEQCLRQEDMNGGRPEG